MLLYWLTNLVIPLRVSHEQEAEGLDLSQHGEEAWAGVGVMVVTNGKTNGHGHGNPNGDGQIPSHDNGVVRPAEPMFPAL